MFPNILICGIIGMTSVCYLIPFHERVLSTPRSVQQENLYGIGWYKILHRTRVNHTWQIYPHYFKSESRQGQSLQSEAISVIHPGDLVYIEATALWKNRVNFLIFSFSDIVTFTFQIRGKLGKNAAGWLTMEDVDRKKVFVEKTKTPPQVIILFICQKISHSFHRQF